VVAPLSSCVALFEGDDERILCLNPDYVGWKLSADDYKNIPNLKAILGAATSFSWVDTTYADDKQMPVCNIRNFSTEAVAEWAITMLFNVARQTPRLIKDGFPLDFDSDFMKYRGVELQGKAVGIVGLGNIGSAIAKRCAGLGMKVNYWSKSPKESDYQYQELAELFANSDVIFPTMALNDETKNLVKPELLSSMKSSAIFISVVHELFDEQLILNMVKDGKLFGFGYEASPATFNNYEGNVWAAPAYAWVTDGSMANSMVKWVDNIVDASQGKYPNKVN
jgi:phosphoglycerate dehydrogenase-like enzyme